MSVDLDLSELYHITEKLLQVANRPREINGLVRASNNGLVCIHELSYRSCEVVRVRAAECLDDFLAVTDGELNAEVFKCTTVMRACQLSLEGSALKSCGDNRDGLLLTLLADSLLLFTSFASVVFENLKLVFTYFSPLPLDLGCTRFEVFDIPT